MSIVVSSATRMGTAAGLEMKVASALSGVLSDLPASTVFTFNGVAYTQAQVAAKLASYQPAFADVRSAKAAYLAALAAREAQAEAARTFLVQLRGALIANFGRRSPTLTQFGMSDKPPAPRTGAQKVVAAAKASLTRQQRGTLGPKAKLALKSVGTPEVRLGLAGVMVAPGAANQALSAAQRSGANPSAGSVAPPLAAPPKTSSP